MRLRQTVAIAATSLSLLLGSSLAQARERLVVRASPDQIEQICANHGLRYVRPLGRSGLHLVAGPKGMSRQQLHELVRTETRIDEFESDEPVRIRKPRHESTATEPPDVVAASIDKTPIDFYGQPVWAGFVHQPATTLIGADWARDSQHTGADTIVAVIDTGVDPNHPSLEGSLIDGYDFTHDEAGGSEWADVDQSAVVVLEQSAVVVLEQSAVVVLEQSAVVVLEGLPLPSAFGHGTMVAGLIHLLAPEAQIMPLKAFTADGESSVSDIVEAIHYAVDNGAKVINMSFSMGRSPQIRRAVRYAAKRGVICVGSAGNQGLETVVYPAGLKRVVGVAATTDLDERADFSNYGEKLVTVTAPGENLVTVFPGGHYALVSGTSFSAALASGAAAVLAGVDPDMRTRAAFKAFETSQFISEELGYGRIDLPAAVTELLSRFADTEDEDDD